MPESVVELEDLSFGYPDAGRLALRDVTLRIGRGEFVGLVGPTGSGKTTLCLTLNGIVPNLYGGDFYGSAKVAGLDTLEHPTHELARYVGMVFEDPEMQLTASTVADEVAFALENLRMPVPEIRRRCSEALAAVRLEGLEGKHPHQLSGGQKQRLAIASALALEPQVLVLDEPTSQLDPVGAEEVFAVARELNRSRGIAILFVSHATEEIAEYADRVVLLSGSKIVAEGPPRELFQDVGLLRAHDVRPPEVTEAFHRMLGDAAHAPYPVTVEDALKQYAEARPPIRLRAATDAEAGNAERPPDRTGPVLLRARDLRYSYDDGTEALKGVSLEIREGEYVAIVGQNGAGKSTLVRQFIHLLEATSGEVEVSGENVNGYPVSELARHIGFVSQNPDNQIFCKTVEQEVAFALVNLGFPKDEVRRRVSEALEEMELGWAADRHPLTLSKGDRSRIVIAAVLAMRPQALIFDEPTTGQDYKGARAIMDLTRELHRSGRTVVVITHHLYLLPGYAERLILMSQGRITLDAPLREAFYETEKLRETFLKPPQMVRFVEAIRSEAAPRLVTPSELAPAKGA